MHLVHPCGCEAITTVPEWPHAWHAPTAATTSSYVIRIVSSLVVLSDVGPTRHARNATEQLEGFTKQQTRTVWGTYEMSGIEIHWRRRKLERRTSIVTTQSQSTETQTSGPADTPGNLILTLSKTVYEREQRVRCPPLVRRGGSLVGVSLPEDGFTVSVTFYILRPVVAVRTYPAVRLYFLGHEAARGINNGPKLVNYGIN